MNCAVDPVLDHADAARAYALPVTDAGRAAVEELERSLGEYRAELPPAHTPLSQVFAESDVDEEETKKLDR